MKLHEKVIKLKGRVSTLLDSNEYDETELMNVEKSMLEEKDELLAHLTETRFEQANLEENMVILKAEKNCAEERVRYVEKKDESLLKEINDLLIFSTE